MVLDDAALEQVAAALHDAARGGADGPFTALSAPEQEKSRHGARALPGLLHELGYEVVPVEDSDGSTPSRDDLERGAQLEHRRWAAYTEELGYRYGPVRDDAALHHPDLVPWEDLDEPTRDKDRIRVVRFVELLPSIGLGLRRIQV